MFTDTLEILKRDRDYWMHRCQELEEENKKLKDQIASNRVVSWK